MNNNDFYSHLFAALEYGERKAEADILQALFEYFDCPKEHPDPARWFSETQAPDAVFGWLIEQTKPFARMLENIYDWLAKIRATADGAGIREIDFDFTGLRDKVHFDLDAFPKTYLRAWADRVALARTFEPAARGRLRADTPNYWRDDIHALSNLSYSRVLEPSVFRELPEPNKLLVASKVRHVLAVLNEHYSRKTTPAGIRHWQFQNFPVLFVKDETDWQRALQLAALPGSDGGIAGSRVASELNDLFRNGIDTGAMVRGARLETLAAAAETAGLSEIGGDPAPIFGPDLERDDTYAFLRAYDICFPPREVTVRELIDIIDRVLLPFWRHRWRLFEVWSLVWLIETIPNRNRPQPRLSHRNGHNGGYVWTLAGGDAVEPVASTKLVHDNLTVWFQLKTPLDPRSALEFGQQHIEPDIRVRMEADGRTSDCVILELKDRHLARGHEEKRVARMYATTGAPVVCVANYAIFGTKSLRGNLHIEDVGDTRIYIVDEFRPDGVPEEIQNAIRRAVAPTVMPDVFIDVSGSMKLEGVIRTLERLANLQVEFTRWFVWSDKCREIEGYAQLATEFSGGTTDLRRALSRHAVHGYARAVILTDGDGARQFRDLVVSDRTMDSRYICVDVTATVDQAGVEHWLRGIGQVL